MLRTGASRALFRSLASSAAPSVRATSYNGAVGQLQLTSRLCTLSTKRPQALAKPLTAAFARLQTTQTQWDKIDKKQEGKVGKEKLEASPELVSSTSSTHPIFGEIGTEEKEDDTDMMAGVKADLRTIKETFSLTDVPRQAYYIGLAGVLPYLGTSLSTVYCAWEITNSAESGSGFLLSHQTAELALHILEPLQIGYGAVVSAQQQVTRESYLTKFQILSFLGAIHWGLEFGQYGGVQGYPRYMIGVVAPAVAWPTILLPAEYALITQFLAFNFLYYADARATVRGWAPPWYSTYRFVLTFIVGASIVVSLIGRGQIADQIGKLPGPADKIKQLRDSQVAALEQEELARRHKSSQDDEDDD
ncbi:hypothetical protein B0A49_05713 [Cryomyces minteri]|uniref:Mitochondrial inner membrane protein 1 n=1 Tax=Cryomyces minteri TaxID=331657 RepID=A0A4U0XHB9_9PEZI|nr:hypothetical protein B0A49_05713 [Cryomyces minteri]